MSGYQALITGIAGLKVQTNVLGTISDNLANVNTVGYKKSSNLFRSLLGNESPASFSPASSSASARSINNAQGLIFGTKSVSDLAVAGNGYFAVRAGDPSTGGLYYTRAGSFTPDANGDFKNTAGFFLQGWLLQDETLPAGLDTASVAGSTAIAALVPVNVLGLVLAANPTTTVSIQGNLTSSETDYAGVPAYDPTSSVANMADGVIPASFNRPISIVDSTGVAHDITIGFLKTSPLNWAVEVYADSAADIGAASAQIASGTITFNNDGSLGDVSASLTSALPISWALPAPATNSITIDWGTLDDTDGLVQFDSYYHSTVNQNGYLAGSISNIDITDEGYIVGNFANGVSRLLYKIPLANFAEQNQLESVTGNVFSETMDSGGVYFTQPGLNGLGKIYSSSLENSNVEVADQLTAMVIAQRSYQFNAKIITTSSDMLDVVTRLKT